MAMIRYGSFTKDSDGRVVQHVENPVCGAQHKDLRKGLILCNAKY